MRPWHFPFPRSCFYLSFCHPLREFASAVALTAARSTPSSQREAKDPCIGFCSCRLSPPLPVVLQMSSRRLPAHMRRQPIPKSARRPQLRHRRPLILPLRLILHRRHPPRQLQPQVAPQRASMRLIQQPNRIQPLLRPQVAAQRKSCLRQQIAQPRELIITQSMRRLPTQPLPLFLLPKHMPQIHQRMSHNRKR